MERRISKDQWLFILVSTDCFYMKTMNRTDGEGTKEKLCNIEKQSLKLGVLGVGFVLIFFGGGWNYSYELGGCVVNYWKVVAACC